MPDHKAGQGPPAGFVVDRRGIPTSHAAYKLLQWLFDHRGQNALIAEVAQAIGLPVETVESMCRQLKLLDMVLEEPPLSHRYRYHLDCWDVELQAAVESAMVDYQMHGHSGLPDGPC